MEKLSSVGSPRYEDQDNGTAKTFLPKTENESTLFRENTLQLLQESNNLLFYPNFEDISNTSSSTSQQNNDSNDSEWFEMLSLEDPHDSPGINSENISTDIEIENQIVINSELNNIAPKSNHGNLWAVNQGGNSFQVSPFEDFIPSIASELNTCGQSRNCFSSSSSHSQLSNHKIKSQTCLLSEDHHSSTDDKCTCGWSKKPPNYWNKDDVQNWIDYIAKVFGINLESKHFEDVASGKQLKEMSPKEFQQRDFIHGKWIYNILKKMFGQVTYSHANSGLSKDTQSHLALKNEDKFNVFFSNLFDENLCRLSVLPLYVFIYAALKSSVLNPQILQWENEQSGVFRFIDPEKFAKLWGLTKKNDNMNYEKLSRSLRHYYPKRILKRVEGKRLIYRFLEPYFTCLKKRVNFNNC